MKRSTVTTLTGLAFAAPWSVALVFFIGYPFVASLYFSLCEFPPLRGTLFVGGANYSELLGDRVFQDAMIVTVAYAVIAIPLGVLLALALALLLNSRIRGQSIYRVVYYLPHLVPSVAVAILWMWMFNPQFGILNVILKPLSAVAAVLLLPFAEVTVPVPGWSVLGLLAGVGVTWRVLAARMKRRRSTGPPQEARTVRVLRGGTLVVALLALATWIHPSDLVKIRSPGWLTDATPFPSGLEVAPSWALWAIIYMTLWGVGQMAVIYLAKLQDVPTELYEAADLDGASWWDKTRHITLPMISPVILFNIVMGIIGAFQVFAEPYIMTGGGPEDKTRFVAMFIYDQAFQYQRLGYASAVAWVLFVVIVCLTLLALGLSRDRVYYAAR